MTVQLTPNGRVWAEKNADDSIVANVAIYGDGWPTAFVESSRTIANEQGEAQTAAPAA
jgi:hypothetical protein